MICQITIFFIYIFFYLQSQAYEFQFGLQYAWTMCIYAVSMTYSITCPIIMPFGECVFVRASSSLCVCPLSVEWKPLSCYCNVGHLCCQPGADCVK